jgi:FlaA1/EpsC-like NDP-sugar epimerase
MWHNFKNPKFYVMIAADLFLFAAAFLGAFLLRFDFALSEGQINQYLEMLKYVLSIKAAVFFGMGMYRGMWRYTSLSDSWKIIEATFLQSVILVTIIFYKFGFPGFSRGVFVIDWGLTFVLTGGLRILIRSAFTLRDSRFAPPNGRQHKRVLLAGAGRAGEKVARDVRDNPALGYEVVGFVDDDPTKRGRAIHGKQILGTMDDIPEIVAKRRADELLITITEASGQQMRRILALCKRSGTAHKILPSTAEIFDGQVSVKALRQVNYLDLLGRSQVELDTQGIEEVLKGQTVLVTGAGGSIGSELVRQIVRFKPSLLVLVDASEFSLYQIEMALKHELGFNNYAAVLGSICDAPLMQQTFEQYGPSVVFHAAAYKHVPMLECNPWQAVTNNILGTSTIMDTAVAAGVKRFVVVSTDKAVRPTNVMGASKRVTELLMRRYDGGAAKFMAVRFGNVLGSSGSVVPLFRRQIENGGPVTVTHPEVTRYFMSIAEAAQLILQAGAMGKGQEIFVLEMGKPVKIADMAVDLIRLSGKEPGRDVEIVFTGLRKGEKLYEELITEGENILRTEHEKIMVLGDCSECADNGEFIAWLQERLDELTAAAKRYDQAEVRRILKILVPELHHEGECALQKA